uniref:La-related protein 7 n=1 Tax=Trichuris muris TaxID=70415 RepID=A0A5S6Q1D2_TRIMR
MDGCTEKTAEAVVQDESPTPTESDRQPEEVKKDAAEAGEISTLYTKILKQIEFYFCDINIARDKFLNAELEKNDNWLPIDSLMNFSRLKSLSSDSKETVVNALKALPSNVVEFNEDMMKIRRLPSLKPVSNTPEFWESVTQRSAVVSGFPKEATLDEIKEFCEKYGNVECVRLRKNHGNVFTGSAFVAFANKEELDKFLSLPTPRYNGTELNVISESEFKAERNNKKKRSQPEKAPVEKAPRTKRRKKELVRRKGVVLFIENVPHHTSLKQIYSLCSPFGTIEWVDHQRDSPTAMVRFAGEENTAVEIVKKVQENPDGQLKILSTELTVRTLTDEEEEDYWQKLAKLTTKKDDSTKKGAANEEENAANSSSKNENEADKGSEAKVDNEEPEDK